jgi:hypothetical protein
MSLREYIKSHRQLIDEHVHRLVPDLRMNDQEREMWVRNDESLYRHARRSGWKDR